MGVGSIAGLLVCFHFHCLIATASACNHVVCAGVCRLYNYNLRFSFSGLLGAELDH